MRSLPEPSLPVAGQVWPPPFDAAEAATLEALLPAGVDELNEVLLARVGTTRHRNRIPSAVA